MTAEEREYARAIESARADLKEAREAAQIELRLATRRNQSRLAALWLTRLDKVDAALDALSRLAGIGYVLGVTDSIGRVTIPDDDEASRDDA